MYGYDFVEGEENSLGLRDRETPQGSSWTSSDPGVLLVTSGLCQYLQLKPEAGGLRPALLAEA